MLSEYDESHILPPITELSAWEWDILQARKIASIEIQNEMSKPTKELTGAAMDLPPLTKEKPPDPRSRP